MNNEIKYSRNDYMDVKCTHREYYSQFVDKNVKSLVLSMFNVNQLVNHFNSEIGKQGYIDLKQWDKLAGGYDTKLKINMLIKAVDYVSLAAAICILKEAAKQIVESHNNNK